MARRDRFLYRLFVLLSPVVPALVGYTLYFQWHTPTPDLYLFNAIFVVMLTFWGIGTLLLLRRFQRKEVRLLFLLTQTAAISLLWPVINPRPWPMPDWIASLSIAGFSLTAALLLHYYLTFPVPPGTSRQRAWGLGAVYGLAPVAIAGGLSLTDLGIQLHIFYSALVGTIATAVLVYVYSRRATPDGRRRLRLIVLGNVLAVSPPLLLYLLSTLTGYPYPTPSWSIRLFSVFAPLSYLYATVRHNLFGIDRLLNRALVYAILSLGVFSLYLGPFLLLYRLLPGDLLLQTVVVAGLTLLVGWSFDWMRTRVQRLVDTLFYGGWYDYPGVVEAVSDALARSLEREQLAGVLTNRVPALMQLHSGQLWIGEPNQSPPLPISPSPHLQFPLTFQDQVRGLWSVGARRDGEDFTAADRRILKTLAREAEIALGNVLLVETLRGQLEEIRASRETLAQAQRQLLHSREEERARLARDLHDGPLQILVSLNLQMGLLLAQAGERNPLLTAAMKDMRAEVQHLLSDLRQVGAELRPPMLDTLGLGAALRALAEEWSAQHGVPIHLELPADATLRPLPEEVAVNLYRVAQEALTNVARHAMARQVTIGLALENSRLTLTVHDDGRGFVPPDTPHALITQGHFGLAGMQERVDLIAGHLTLASSPGRGTSVRVVWQARWRLETAPTPAKHALSEAEGSPCGDSNQST